MKKILLLEITLTLFFFHNSIGQIPPICIMARFADQQTDNQEWNNLLFKICDEMNSNKYQEALKNINKAQSIDSITSIKAIGFYSKNAYIDLIRSRITRYLAEVAEAESMRKTEVEKTEAQIHLELGKLKALFIFNFINYIEFPNKNEIDIFKIGILGKDKYLEDALEELVKGKIINKKSIETVRFLTIQEISKTQILFVTNSESYDFKSISQRTNGQHTLLVTDQNYRPQTMINFISVNNKIKFELDLKNCEKEKIKVSSTLVEMGLPINFTPETKYLSIRQNENSNSSEIIRTDEDWEKEINGLMKELDSKKGYITKQLNLLVEKDLTIQDSKSKIENQKNRLFEQQSKIETQKLILYLFIFIIILILGFALFVYRSYKRKQKDNIIITKQKQLVEEKNREITQSIEYALRIQTAILPPQKIVRQYLENSFILYKPKDIVAGDFYWMENVGDFVLFAACDCTGHGVPGAMVSVVCHNALNRAVREFGLIQPAAILDKTAEIVIENFSKSEEKIKDGMDISLCAYNVKTKIIQWAGANNPLWLIQNGKLIETKADKQPIGMSEDSKPFTNNTFTLQTDETIYLFTDGFADQFGGQTGHKKLTKKRFKDLILSIQNKTMKEQGIELDKFIIEYRKQIEQIDDILVMGVKV
jgi:serine phosphatase RsbU (regulator of sigma subunit)